VNSAFNTTGLALGSGGILDRYDYISVNTGTIDADSVVATENGLYWVDRLNKSIWRYNSQLDNLSLSKLINNWSRQNILGVSTAGMDRENKEILFTIKTTTDENSEVRDTLVFSETMDAFVGFFDMYSKPVDSQPKIFGDLFFNKNNKLYSSVTRSDAYIQNRGKFDTFFERTLTSMDATITFVCNKYYPATKVFDSFKLNTEAVCMDETDDNYLKVIPYETFDRVICWNDKFDSGTTALVYIPKNRELPVTGEIPLVRREQEWNLSVPRNATTLENNLYPDYDKLGDTIQEQDRLFRERIRGKFMFVKFMFDNIWEKTGEGDIFLKIPFIQTNFRVSVRS